MKLPVNVNVDFTEEQGQAFSKLLRSAGLQQKAINEIATEFASILERGTIVTVNVAGEETTLRIGETDTLWVDDPDGSEDAE
jgi:hypothetical protein